MATIKFKIQGTGNPSPIYIRFQDGRKINAKTKTGYFINPVRWSHKRSMPIGSMADEKVLITKLRELELKVLDEYSKKTPDTPINISWLSAIVKYRPSEEVIQEIGLVEYFTTYYDQKKSTGSKLSLLKKVKSQQAIFKAFDKYKGKNHTFTDIDSMYGDKLIKFLKGVKGYKQSYIFRTVKFLKTVCRDAQRNGILVNGKFELIKCNDEKSIKIYLSESELEKIRNVKLCHDYLDNARDWLLISCYIGQRVSDFLDFTSDNIVTTEKGTKVISFTQQKTKKDQMSILMDEAIEVLNKRQGEFPRKISDQKYNEYVKEVAKLAGLTELTKGSLFDAKLKRNIDGVYEKWQLISSHIGRRSFATNFYGKYPTSMLMANTGHSTERAFLEYIGKGRLDYIEAFADLIKSKKE